jgi:DinB superfamily
MTLEERALSRTELVESFSTFPERLAAAAQAGAGSPVAAGEWGPAEVVRHLIAVEREIYRVRLAQLAVEDDPQWSWWEPAPAREFEGRAIDEIIAGFAAVRDETVATVLALDDAGWARTGTHATFGVLDVAGLLGIAVGHDREHLEGIAAAPAG